MKKVLLIMGLILVGLIIGSWLVLRINHDKIRLKAENAIDQNIDAVVSFNDLSFSFLRHFPNFTVTLNDLMVRGKQKFSNDTLAVVKEIDFELKMFPLLSGEVEMKSIHINSPRAVFKVLKTGEANYNIMVADSQQSSKKDTDTSPLRFALDEFSITDGEFDYVDQSQNITAFLKKVTYSGKGDFQKDIFDLRTITDIKELTLNYENTRLFSKKEVEIDLNMEIDLNKNTFVLKENFLRINHFRFGLEGDFGILANGYDLNLRFATEATDFKNIISLLPGIYMKDFENISTQGELSFNGFVDGSYLPGSNEIPSFLANIKVSNARFKIDSLPAAVENIQMEMALSNLTKTLDSTVFDIKNFQFEMLKHMVKGRLKVQGISNYAIDTDIIADLDLAELEKMYPIKGLDIKGTADFELKAKGNLNLTKGLDAQVPIFDLAMNVKDGRVKYDHLPAAIDNIQFELLAKNETGNAENTIIDFKKMHVDLDKNKVRGFLMIEGFDNLKIRTDIKAEVDLGDIEKLFPLDGITMSGHLSADIEADGIYNKITKKFPSIDANLSLTDGMLQTSQYPEPVRQIHLLSEVINATGQFSDTKIDIKRLTYSLEDEPFEVSGSVSDLTSYNYDLKVKGIVDLEKITKIYPVKGYKIKGIIATDLNTRGRVSDIDKGQFERVISSGTMDIKNISVQSPAIKKSVVIHEGRFVFTPTKIVLEKLEADFGKSTASAAGDILNYMAFATHSNDVVKWDLVVKCDTLDLNEWFGEPTEATGPSSQINIVQIPKNMDATFDSQIGRLYYEDFNISALDGEIKMKDGIMSFSEAGFNSLDANFKLTGDYNTKDSKHPMFDFILDIDSLDIQKAYKQVKLMRDLMPSAANAFGIFSLDYKLKGELNPDVSPKMETIVGGGEMRIANAKINGMKIFQELSKATKKKEVNDPHLRDFVMLTEIRDNKIFVKPFAIKVSGFDTDVEGVSEMTGAINYLVKIDLPPFGLKIPFHVTGTSDKPKIAIGKGHRLPEDTVRGPKYTK